MEKEPISGGDLISQILASDRVFSNTKEIINTKDDNWNVKSPTKISDILYNWENKYDWWEGTAQKIYDMWMEYQLQPVEQHHLNKISPGRWIRCAKIIRKGWDPILSDLKLALVLSYNPEKKEFTLKNGRRIWKIKDNLIFLRLNNEEKNIQTLITYEND
jgi:hypothetical protein